MARLIVFLGVLVSFILVLCLYTYKTVPLPVSNVKMELDQQTPQK